MHTAKPKNELAKAEALDLEKEKNEAKAGCLKCADLEQERNRVFRHPTKKHLYAFGTFFWNI